MDFSGLVISNYYEIIQWFTTNGGGEFIPNDNVPEPVYVPSPSIDFPQGCIQIGVVASPIDPCSVFAEDFMDLCFQPEPQVFAGNDATICLDIDNIEFPLFDANVENELSINWVTSGDGFFENISSVTTTYTLGENDLISGMVELCLQAEPISPCLDIISHCLTLTIAPIPEFDCPEYGPFCAGDDMITFEGEGVYTQDGEIVTTFDPETAGTYFFTYTEINAFGCEASCEFEIVVNPLPEFDCPEYGPFCAGSPPSIRKQQALISSLTPKLTPSDAKPVANLKSW